MCHTRWADDYQVALWKRLARQRNDADSLFKRSLECLGELWAADPAIQTVLSDLAIALRTCIHEINRRIPPCHREWRKSKQPVFEADADGPRLTSRWGERAQRAQAGYLSLYPELLRVGLVPEEAVSVALEAMKIAGMVAASSIDPRYLGPEQMRAIVPWVETTPGADVRFGEPDQLRSKGIGGRNPRPNATAENIAIFEKLFMENWPAPNPDGRERRRSAATNLVELVVRVLHRRGRHVRKSEVQDLTRRVLHPSTTPHSFAVRCVAILERRKPESIRKTRLGRNDFRKARSRSFPIA
jgi:hypothetical protein